MTLPNDANVPYLLTPGPLTTSDRVKKVMLRDWGSRDPDFENLTARVCASLKDIAGAGDDYACVPMQGSGTFAVEAMIVTLVPRDGHLLVLANGAYGRRIADIAKRAGLKTTVLEQNDDTPNDPQALRAALRADDTIGQIAVIHCETTSGLLNPIAELAAVCRDEGRQILVDSMSGFGALPINAGELGLTAVAASANKCLQGAPGVGYVITQLGALEAARGNAPSIVLDLEEQHRQLMKDGQWRFTPPTHVMAALGEALDELADEGGAPARLKRYRANYETLAEGMKALGFERVLADELQAPIIVSFHEPQQDWFDFDTFYDMLKDRGFAIYSGKMRALNTFRIGVIGDLDKSVIEMFLDVAKIVITEMKSGR